jgi:hypothetical protein
MMQMNNSKELFVTGDDGFNYRQIDRIQNTNDTYSYCIGGKITCKKTPLVSTLIDVSSNNYFGGKTYKPYCKTETVEDPSNNVYCDGTMFSKLNQSAMPTYTLPKSKFTFPISVDYLGMTQPYSYVPAAIDASNNNKLNFIKNQSGAVVEYMDICDPYYQTDQDNCKKKLYGSINSTTIIGNAVGDASYNPPNVPYDPSLWLNQKLIDNSLTGIWNPGSSGTSANGTSASIPSSKTSSITSPINSCETKSYPQTDCSAKIPCVADFGAEIGDNLCCGQTGVLQNTKNICPVNKPTCSNFDCKTQLGYCQ